MGEFNCTNCGSIVVKKGKTTPYKTVACSPKCKTANKSKIRKTLAERLYSKTRTMPNGCIEWIGAISSTGYGSILHSRGRRISTHVAAWELKYGPVPKGKFVLHKCDNRPCINTDHLFLGTAKDNGEDMAKKRRSTWGERDPMAKLAESDIEAIKQLAGTMSQRAIGEKFGVSDGNICMILGGKRWGHTNQLRVPVERVYWKHPGELCPTAKLKNEDVIEIRQLRGQMTISELARKYAVTWHAIADILSGKNWKHLLPTAPAG